MIKACILNFILCISILLSVLSASAEPPKRIVSLAPSTTELLFAMGLGDRVVGDTSFCDYPEEAKKTLAESKPSRTEEILQVLPSVRNAEVKYSPFWAGLLSGKLLNPMVSEERIDIQIMTR